MMSRIYIKKKRIVIFMLLAVVFLLSACGQKAVAEKSETAKETVKEKEFLEEKKPSEEDESAEEKASPIENVVYEATFQELTALLGKQDPETANLLGGGEENWTEDKNFYIGRIYQVQLFDAQYPVYTSCDENWIINSVSIWLANGERKVSKEEVEQWVQRLTEFAESEAAYDEISSEAGSKKWQWKLEDKFLSLMWTGDILTISMNPAVGELH